MGVSLEVRAGEKGSGGPCNRFWVTETASWQLWVRHIWNFNPHLGFLHMDCVVVITLNTLQSTFHIRCKLVKDTSLINSCIARWHAPIIPVLGRCAWKMETRVKGHPWLHYKFNTSGVTWDSAVTEQVVHKLLLPHLIVCVCVFVYVYTLSLNTPHRSSS